MVGDLQFPQRDTAQCAALQRPPHQRVLRALDRPEQQRPRFEPAQEVPVPLRDGVHREQVERAPDDEPQDLRPLQREAAHAGAVHRGAQRAERGGHLVARGVLLVRVRHVSAP